MMCNMRADRRRAWRMHPPPPPARLRILLDADPRAVRAGLRRLLTTTPMCDLSDDFRGTTEIVLAEVLNNVVEHAYAGQGGQIEVTLDYEHPILSFEVADTGVSMPAGRLPVGALTPLQPDTDLPEGGFGWFLIRTLTQGMTYRRRSDGNRLTFWMEAE